jgi:lipopolysaccharide/colanic/teichoic acid biosynthesis glycosyltransferase
MVNHLFIHSRALVAPLAIAYHNFQAWMDGLLVRAEGAPPEAPAKSGFPIWAIILVAVVLLLCLLPVCILIILTLLGPAIGNVFPNIQEGI